MGDSFLCLNSSSKSPKRLNRVLHTSNLQHFVLPSFSTFYNHRKLKGSISLHSAVWFYIEATLQTFQTIIHLSPIESKFFIVKTIQIDLSYSNTHLNPSIARYFLFNARIIALLTPFNDPAIDFLHFQCFSCCYPKGKHSNRLIDRF